MALGMACFNILVLLLLGDQIAVIFTTDAEVIALVMEMRHWLILFHLLDAFQSTLLGVLRGMGRQTVGVAIIGITYLSVGTPFGVLLFFTTNLGVQCLWIGPVVGLYGFGIPLFAFVWWRQEWSTLRPHTEVSAEVIAEEKMAAGDTEVPPPNEH